MRHRAGVVIGYITGESEIYCGECRDDLRLWESEEDCKTILSDGECFLDNQCIRCDSDIEAIV